MQDLERLNIQMDNGQILYKNKTLTLQLPLIYNKHSRKPATDQSCRKPDCYPQRQSQKLNDSFFFRFLRFYLFI